MTVAVSALLAPGALAGEHCVQCTGPTASYRCAFEGPAADAASKLECITAVARQGSHETCAVRPGTGVCAGAVIRLGGEPGEASPMAATGAPLRPPAVASPPAPQAMRPPAPEPPPSTEPPPSGADAAPKPSDAAQKSAYVVMSMT